MRASIGIAVAGQAVGVAGAVEPLVVVAHAGRGLGQARRSRRTSSSPIAAWVRITCPLGGVERAAACARMRSGIATLPTSCSQPPRRQRITIASRQPELRRRSAPTGRRPAGSGAPACPRARDAASASACGERGPPRRPRATMSLDRSVAEQPHLVAAAALRGVQRPVGRVDEVVDRPQPSVARGARRPRRSRRSARSADGAQRRRRSRSQRARRRRAAPHRRRRRARHAELLAAPAGDECRTAARGRARGAARRSPAPRRRPRGRRCR